MPQFLRHLRTGGVGVYLGRSGSRLVLVYALKIADEKNPYAPWYGYAPTAQLSHPKINPERLPARLTGFYRQLHSRFEYGMAIRNGVVPIEELAIVGDYGLENMEYYGTDRRPSLADVVAFFAGFGSCYLCLELTGDPEHVGGWLWVENSVAPCEDVWRELDTWLVQFTDW